MRERVRLQVWGMGMLLCAAVLPPSASSAADAVVPASVAAEAKVYLDKGNSAFDQGEYQAAFEAYQKALTLRRNAGGLAQMASTLNALGRYDEALRMYEEVLRDFPNASAGLRKKVKGDLDLLVAKVGTIAVEGDVVEGARLFVDSREVGAWPLKAPLIVVSGVHEVRADMPGFEPIKASVEVSAGKPSVVKLLAKEKLGRLEIREKHNWVLTVALDGKDVGTTPLSMPVSVGEHRIRLHGYMQPEALLLCETPEKPVEMGARMASGVEAVELSLFETKTVELSAEDLDASLHIEVTPPDALITIDDGPVATTPWNGRLPLGEHSIEVRAKGYFVSKQRVVLERRKQRELTIALERVPDPPGFWTGRNMGTAAGLGLGLVGLGFFGVTGGMALQNASELKAACVDGICPGNRQDQLDRTHSLGNAALGGIIVGGVGMLAGAAVWVFAAPKGQKRETREQAGLRVEVGPGGASVLGRF